MNDPARRLGRAGGHRYGGPLLLLLVAVVLGACGGRSGSPDAPGPERGGALERPLDVYANLGMLTGTDDFPAVGGFSTLAGPGDSTYVLLGMSIPSRALRFEREDGGFGASYHLTLVFERDGAEVERLEREEQVRVPTFAETARADEAVVFQALVILPPGVYDVRLGVRDGRSRRAFERESRLTVPGYGAGSRRASAVVVYRAGSRASAADVPDLIVNPRHTVPFGSAAPLIYLESYDPPGAAADVDVRVLDEAERRIWTGRTNFNGGDGVSHALLEIPADSLPMGRLWIEMDMPDASGGPTRAPLLVSMSDQWMIQNFDEVLRFLDYIAVPAELDSLREATGRDRAEIWDRFWERRNPTPASPVNEFREEFFDRVRIATEQLTEGSTPGWRTDRGRVYIVLGPPDRILPRHVGRRETGPPNAVEWIYHSVPAARLELIFVDRHGFGRFELTRRSEDAFRAVADRLKPRPRR